MTIEAFAYKFWLFIPNNKFNEQKKLIEVLFTSIEKFKQNFKLNEIKLKDEEKFRMFIKKIKDWKTF